MKFLLQPSLMGIAFILALSGCGPSPKEASKQNFKAVINDRLSRECIFINPISSIYANRFPVEVKLSGSPDTEQGRANNAGEIKRYEVLRAIGLLEVVDGTVEESVLFSDRKNTYPTKTYSLTKKGKPLYREAGRRDSGFCVGHFKVDEIVNFSEPAAIFSGFTVSEVSYTASPTKVVSWAKKPEVLEAFEQLENSLKEGQKQEATLGLMADGWIHEADTE